MVVDNYLLFEKIFSKLQPKNQTAFPQFYLHLFLFLGATALSGHSNHPQPIIIFPQLYTISIAHCLAP